MKRGCPSLHSLSPGQRARFALWALGIGLGLGGVFSALKRPSLAAETWASRPVAELEALARRDPRSAGAQLGLGIQYARAGETARAAAALERCVALAPDTLEAYAALGEIARRQGDDRRAATMFARAVRVDPSFDEGYLQAANAFTHLQSYSRARPYAAAYACRAARDWQGPFLLGMIRAGEGRMVEALAHYAEAVRRAPDHAPTYLNAGATFLYGPATPDRLAAAADWFQRGLSVSPSYAELHYYLGLVRFRQRRWSEASDSLRRAVAFNPSLTEAYYPLAQSLRKQGRATEAKLCLELFTRLRAREQGSG
jgi:tetratricopeptide (TPR) repeat protein